MASNVGRFICERVKNSSYKGVETIEQIAQSIGLPVDQLVKLNANENVYGPPQAVLDAIAKADHWVYPDPAQTKIRAALAELHKEHGAVVDNIIAGAGSDDILDIVMRLVSPEKIIISTPTFGMYDFLAKVAGTEVVDVKRRADFSVDVDGVVAAIRKHKAKICFLPSPNNPTGTILPNADAEILLKEDCILVVDEAYADFCDVTALELFTKYDNLIVCRTFSKWAGLAGLRLGYAIGHSTLVTPMMAIKQPYNVNTASEVAGLAALTHRDEIMKTVVALRQEKNRLATLISEEISWLRCVPSDANFILNEVMGGISAEAVYKSMRNKGVLIRYFGTQGGDLSNYIRISAGKPSDSDRVLQVLKEIGRDSLTFSQQLHDYNTQALLFDMDGVLADVTFSQHTAIIETAKLYGVIITEDDIGAVKAKGNANNDWQVTVDMINAAGVSPTAELAKVTEQWEALYQGSDTAKGLWEVETLLTNKSLLKKICNKYPSAIVTGRPRADAVRFLKQHDIEDCFKFLVCYGEAALKPAPDGVKLALATLGVERALFIGDTVDDVIAGVAAGIKSIGVVAPSVSDKNKTKQLLLEKGASEVFSEGLHEFSLLL